MKVMKPVVGFVRSKEVQCVVYIDDFLLMHQKKQDLMKRTALTLNLLETLGFLVNYSKSHLQPSQRIEYLGFMINSLTGELSLPKEKVVQIRSEAIRLMDQDLVSARELTQLIGKMLAAILAVYPAPLHYRNLQALKHKALVVTRYDGTIRISPDAREPFSLP